MNPSKTVTSRAACALRVWSRHPALQDAALAVALLAACELINSPTAVVTVLTRTTPGAANATELAAWWAASLLATTAVALRRRWPLPMLAAATVATATHMAQAVPFMIIDVGV